MNCWNCGKTLTNLPQKIAFRELCSHCDSYLHCCKNCIHYQPGLTNNCKIPGTEPVRDRTSLNFCEDFEILGNSPKMPEGSLDAWKKLFGSSRFED